ncbi:MAG: serine hydrolase [Candidatus Nanopelagicales bacterium]
MSTVRNAGVAALVIAALAGCGGTSGGASESSSGGSASAPGGLPYASPAASGNPGAASDVQITDANVDKALSSLDAIVEQAMAHTNVPGVSVAVVRNGEVAYLKGFGVRNLQSGEKVDEDTVFQLASVSKPIGASVIASVIGDGKVKWTDKISTYLPDFALSDPYATANVTIADMYSHRSGLPDHAGDLLEDIGYNQAEVLYRLRYLPLEPFRANYAYTNFGITAGAEAVAKATGTDWPTLSKQRVYEPLGMTSTSSNYADYVNAANKATTYDLVEGKYVVGERDPQAQSPAGGVSSTAADMAKWLQMQLADGEFEGKKVVDAQALQTSRVPHMTSSPAKQSDAKSGLYGLGTGVGTDAAGRVRYSHSGGFQLGAATVVNLLPSAGLGIAVLSNSTPQGTPEAIAEAFYNIAETGEISRDWNVAYGQVMTQEFLTNTSSLADKQAPTSPVPSPPLADLVGTYSNDFFGPQQVVERNGALVLVLGPKKLEIPMTHWDGNTYSITPVGENLNFISAVEFTVPAGGGAATQVKVEALNGYGQGTLTRASG